MNLLSENPDLDEILKLLIKLEKRISRIEEQLQITSPSASYNEKEEEQEPQPQRELVKENLSREDNLEYRIGQFWFAKVGIVVLIIGFVFLLTLPYENSPSIFPIILGYFFSVGLIFLSQYWKKNFSHIRKQKIDIIGA